MLHIVKQYRKMIFSFLENNFEQNNYWWQETKKPLDIKDINQAVTLDEMVKLINNSEIDINNNDHKEFLKKFIKEIAKKSWNESSVEESDISDSVFSNERYAFSNVINLLKSLNQFKSVDWKMKWFTDSEIKMLNDFIWETWQVIADAAKWVSEVKEDVIRTWEQNSEVTNSVLWIDTSNTTRAEMISQVNRGSLESLISKLSFAELWSLINEISTKSLGWKNPRNYNYTWYWLWNNYSWLSDILEKAWYSVKWALDNKEAAGVVLSLTDAYDTQEKLNNSSDFKSKLAIIFDYNKDGLLDNKVHFYTKEKQFFDAIKTEDQFNNLLQNLGYSDKSVFDMSFDNNYYSAREDFKTRLATILSVTNFVNPSEMLKNPKALQEFNAEKIRAEKALTEEIEKNPKTKDLPKETKDLIKLQAAWVLVWSTRGLWLSFDIKWLTKNLIDSLQIGIVNGVPWIWISKNLIKNSDGTFRVDGALVNLIPIISASWVIKKAEYDEFKKLFPSEIDSKTQVTLAWGISSLASSVIIDFSKADETTKLWIERAKEKMLPVLDKIFSEIEAWKTFEQSSLKEEESNRYIYEQLASLYKANWSNPDFSKFLKEWALKNYERALYQNADGLNYAWISVWLIFLVKYLPIPFIWASFDYNKTDWSKKNWVNISNSTTLPSEWQNISTSPTPNPEPKVVRENLRSSYESGTDIHAWLSSFENAFSFRTRYNKWAEALMSPSGTLETRWKWLTQLSQVVKALKDVKLNEFLKTVKTDNEKWLVISTISQYMKKANDFNNWDVKSWNENVDSYISKDKSRRKAFNTLMWPNLDAEADAYYKELSKWKWKITKETKLWVWFDATSSINVEWSKVIKWMDTLYTNLSILSIDGKPLLIPITDKSKIDAFKEKIKSSKNVSDDVKLSLITWIENGSVELNFYKDPEGFDDRILPIIKKTIPLDNPTPEPGKPNEQPVDEIEVFQPEHSSIKIGLGWTWDKELKDKPTDKPTETPTTTPTDSPTPPPTTEPTLPPTVPPTLPPTLPPTVPPTVPPTLPPNVPTTMPTSSPTPPPSTWTWGDNGSNNF